MKRNTIAAIRLLLTWGVLIYGLTVYGQAEYDSLLKAKSLMDDNDYGAAILSLEAFGNTGNVSILLERGTAYLEQGDYSKAIKDFNSANKVAEGAGEYGLAKAYALKGDAPTAVYHLELNMNGRYKKEERDILLEKDFKKIEHSREWKNFIKKDRYSKLETTVSEIKYDLSTGQTTEAVSLLAEIMHAYPDNEIVIYTAAQFDVSVEKYSSAKARLTALLANDKDNEDYLRLMAEVRMGAKEYAAAAEVYSQLIDMEVVDASLYKKRAECRMKIYEYDKALADINKYISLYPKDLDAVSLAGTIATASGNNLEALVYYSKNIENNPNNPKCYIERGDAYFMAKSWQWAADDYGMALDLDPGNALTWLNKGLALIHLKNIHDGCFCIKQAVNTGNRKAIENYIRYCSE